MLFILGSTLRDSLWSVAAHQRCKNSRREKNICMTDISCVHWITAVRLADVRAAAATQVNVQKSTTHDTTKRYNDFFFVMGFHEFATAIICCSIGQSLVLISRLPAPPKLFQWKCLDVCDVSLSSSKCRLPSNPSLNRHHKFLCFH